MTKAGWLTWVWQIVQFMALMIGTGAVVASMAAIKHYRSMNERDKRAAKAAGWRQRQR